MTGAAETRRPAGEDGTVGSGGPDAAEVAYQGRPGAFGEAAARAVAGAVGALLPCPTFEAVVAALAAGKARRAVLPVVNTAVGGVGEALDLVAARTDTAVVGAVTVPVAMALVAPPGVAFGAIRRVRSHPVALAQCRAFFRAHPHIEPVIDFDTAGAVEAVVAAGQGDEAALGSVRAARVYGGCVLRERVQDHARNATRFLVLARAGEPSPEASEAMRHAVAVWTGADAGLAEVLARLAAAGWRLAHIERRPADDGDGSTGRFVLDLAWTGGGPRAPNDARPPGPPPSDRMSHDPAATGLVVRGQYGQGLRAAEDAG